MNSTILIATAILAIISYLLGSISFAVIFTNHYAHTDVRQHGSGNAGMTNVLRTAGKKPAILTFICDFLKGAVAAGLGKYAIVPVLSNVFGVDISGVVDPLYFAYLAGLFSIIGHIFPIFFGFKGGKGVATTAGIFVTLDWRVGLIAMGLFVVIVLISGIVSIGSVISAATLPFTTYFFYDTTQTFSFELFGLPQHIVITIFSAIFAIIVFVKHIDNMKRLVKGEEKKIFHKKK